MKKKTERPSVGFTPLAVRLDLFAAGLFFLNVSNELRPAILAGTASGD
ncbi:MAG TPA: hypothetical protein PKZ67_05100 [Accumulibacter sp.]|nr:hypothetical protein [Accumulibacter sp.]HNF91562.1 hypothetical protein [Accumulibacter sp.]HNO73096.1 hypothetical protein [Accumulibacter sp.]